METNNKLKAKLLMFSILSAFYSSTFGEENDTGNTDVSQSSTPLRIDNGDGTVSVTHTYNPSDIIQIGTDKTHFVEDFVQGPILNIGEQLIQGEKIASGSYGTIWEVVSKGKRFIRKQANTQEKSYSMRNDLNQSLALLEAVKKYTQNSKTPNLHAVLMGLGSIALSIGEMSDGSIIQEYVDGVDLFESPQSATRNWLKDSVSSVIRNRLGGVATFAIRFNLMRATDVIIDRYLDDLSASADEINNNIKNNLTKEIDAEVENQLSDSIEPALVSKIIDEMNAIISKSRCDFFNDRGFPRHPKEAIRALCSLLHALITLHTLGYVHYDLKEENVILTKGGALKLIDLGTLISIGTKTKAHSSNGAPEFLYADRLHIPSVQEANTAYDIYCLSGVILSCLFGLKGLRESQWYFYAAPGCDLRPQEDLDEPAYIREMSKNPDIKINHSETRIQFFNEMVDNLNNSMGRQIPDPRNPNQMITVGNYPPHVLKVIKEILMGVTEINPDNRPSAVEILEKLQGLALSDWNDTTRPEEERYRIDRHPKLPEISEENKPINWDADWLEEYPVVKPTQQQQY